MSRNIFLFCLYCLILISWSGYAQESRPNIIVFLSDDHGQEDAGCYGNPDLKTPVIDLLATEGMRFTHAFTPVSVCAPSRSALFTGLYPHRNGCDRNHSQIRSGIKTLPDYLLPLGYEVVLAGKVHVKPEAAFNFTYIGREEIPAFLKSAGGKPFCLIISYNSPHQPYFNKKEGYQKVEPKAWLPETAETLQFTEAYYDNVDHLDHEIGAHLYWVEKYGFSDAFQIYTSDHGPAFPFAKWSLYNQGIRVPLIVKWKDRIKPGTVNEGLVSLVDLLPTMIEIAGGNPPGDLDGISMKSMLYDGSSQHLQYVYAAYTNLGVMGASEYPIRAIQDKNHKLIVNLRSQNNFEIRRMNEPDSRALIDSYQVLQSWLKSGNQQYIDRAKANWQRPRLELYDLNKDPYELSNLVADEEMAEIKDKLLSQLAAWMKTQNDPFATELTKIESAP